MATEVFPLRLSAAGVILVQLYNPDTDEALDLTGCTLDASADAGGVDMSQSIYDAATGIVSVYQLPDTFSAAGTYSLSIGLTDTAGRYQIYPLEAGQLILSVA